MISDTEHLKEECEEEMELHAELVSADVRNDYRYIIDTKYILSPYKVIKTNVTGPRRATDIRD